MPLLVLVTLVAPHAAPRSLILATTTSTHDSGLLDLLVPQFEKAADVEVKTIAVGTGAALRMASRGDADVVLVHAPDAEREYVEAGHLIEGRRVMYNDFILVGPAADPAGVRGHRSLDEAMKAIAARGTFVSRGDNSGTHVQELALWRKAGIMPASIARREETGQGMGATLTVADQKDAYTLTDRGTWLALRRRLQLTLLYAGDPSLRNVYHVYAVNPVRHPRVNLPDARAFIAFLISPDVQRTIGGFRRAELGEPLFFADADPPPPR